MVADAKEYLTNRAQLRIGGDWRVKLHELVVELLALCLEEFLSNEPFHFERFEEWQERTREGGEIWVGWLLGWSDGPNPLFCWIYMAAEYPAKKTKELSKLHTQVRHRETSWKGLL